MMKQWEGQVAILPDVSAPVGVPMPPPAATPEQPGVGWGP